MLDRLLEFQSWLARLSVLTSLGCRKDSPLIKALRIVSGTLEVLNECLLVVTLSTL